ncbi:hypothetical protein cypCar_00035598 [Cyprinus carpio]|nr:hypothetical protein cypCar_00035598 [Cyprinus carpio]
MTEMAWHLQQCRKFAQIFAPIENHQIAAGDRERPQLLQMLKAAGERQKLCKCSIGEEGCFVLASALRSNPLHLRELNLSLNKPGNSVKFLSDLLEDTNCKLESLNQTYILVYLGPPHRDVRVPEFALSAAHLRTCPELIARYLKFIFPEDVLVRSNVYGGMRRGIQALNHNKISALRDEISDQGHCSLLLWMVEKRLF